ncbi:unnamed protein product [Dibothriocephalus latus]|uniref:Uncharacterized protein n=1 Tax=Dibothriocephalus latus TaxID=60516 RepID=A0A3P7LEG9_DIBLA|nr:unnamed protein product [Dibothriocephalus latus]
MAGFLKKTLPRELEVFVEKLIIAFKLNMIQDAVHDFKSDMSGLSSASDYIEKNWKNIVPAVEQKGQELNDALNEIKTGCPYLEQEADKLRSNFNKALVKEIPADLNTALATTSAKLKQMSDKLDGVMEQVGSVHTTISQQIQENLDVASMLEELNGMWDTIDSNLTPMEQKMDQMMNTVFGFLGQYSSLVKALLFVLAIPFLLAAIFFTLFLVVFIVEAIYRHLFSLTGTSASEVAAADPWIAKSCVCGGGKFCCCSCLLILPVLLLGIFACLAITLNGFAGVEVCPYITNTTGINMTDYVLNSKVQTIWNDAVNSAGPSGSQTGGFGNLLNPKPPQNLLYAVEVGCAPSAAAQETPAPGLLAQMGLTNLVDFREFVNDPTLTNKLAKVKT